MQLVVQRTSLDLAPSLSYLPRACRVDEVGGEVVVEGLADCPSLTRFPASLDRLSGRARSSSRSEVERRRGKRERARSRGRVGRVETDSSRGEENRGRLGSRTTGAVHTVSVHALEAGTTRQTPRKETRDSLNMRPRVDSLLGNRVYSGRTVSSTALGPQARSRRDQTAWLPRALCTRGLLQPRAVRATRRVFPGRPSLAGAPADRWIEILTAGCVEGRRSSRDEAGRGRTKGGRVVSRRRPCRPWTSNASVVRGQW